MIRYECDKCGRFLAANDRQRFIVKMEIYAAADHLDLDADAHGDPERAMDDVLRELAAADPDEVEDQTYRSFRFDVCDACRRRLLARPLGSDT
ncbi:MAG: hypothetical protein ACE5HE_03355 [Phycisphaerae bacterium]